MFARLVPLFVCFIGIALAIASPAESQSADLGGLSIGDIINALQIGFIQNITTFITLDTLSNNIASSQFRVKNPLIIELTIDSTSAKAGLNGTTYAEFTHTFKPALVVPVLRSVDSPTIGNVDLVQGATASLDIIPFGVLDLQNVDINIRAGTLFGLGGIPIPITGLKQSNVPAAYDLELD
ncbi:hypothetical protein E1B28_001929 [Marasmius oreades]|uniref:Uncharacterized protein n=1 Tax=Marasmius oreades TaxID=181124 RepID=A0A9P7V4D6_9AGAR|nr:uncharacterized protein E1B28_001929 [Marasmius oreades]KAG7100150.1 hypothetical protein E1B28_001929 [Marasmius oreades]